MAPADDEPRIAELDWGDDGLPRSRIFDDVYFSPGNGLEESCYVYLQHNGLPERWHSLADQSLFTIAETGFGTGLNFLASWQLWRQHAPDNARLEFISVEKYPLTTADLTRALALWPQLGDLSHELIAAYPLLSEGYHRLSFDQGRVALTLIIDDASRCYEHLDTTVDAWFLDGFTPSRNPDMWTESLLHSVGRWSRPGTTFATFTAASRVRRQLQTVGFSATVDAGFGPKRHMLYGKFDTPPAPVHQWYQRPRISPPKTAIVIGAGIAGASTARALAERGISVSVYDRGPEPGCEGSGNPQGVLYAKLPAQPTPQSRIHLTGYTATLTTLQRLAPAEDTWHPCGVLQLPPDSREQQRQQRLLAAGRYPETLVRGVDRDEASSIAGVELPSGGLWFPGGGWVAPARLCATLLDHPLISCHFNTEVTALRQQDNGWELLDNPNRPIAASPVVVVACAASSARFEPLQALPLKSIRGQISIADSSNAPSLNTVLCGKGYVSPPLDQRYCFGATFTLHEHTPATLAADHEHNLAHLNELCPSVADALSPQFTGLQGRVGFRCATPDYLPLAGPVANHDAFIELYAPLRHDASSAPDQPPPLLEGLYVNLGHGSKGLITAPLCGELVAAQISGGALPLDNTLIPYLHPARFLVKDLKRRAI